MQGFDQKFSVVTILQRVKFSIFYCLFARASQQCSANTLSAMKDTMFAMKDKVCLFADIQCLALSICSLLASCRMLLIAIIFVPTLAKRRVLGNYVCLSVLHLYNPVILGFSRHMSWQKSDRFSLAFMIPRNPTIVLPIWTHHNPTDRRTLSMFAFLSSFP